jgi:hypothetical protein
LDPISITPVDIDQYEDIQNALVDRRSLQKIAEVKADDCFLTPDFLETFDMYNMCGRDYLRVRMKFAAVKLGFVAYTVANNHKESKNIVTVKCGVGQKHWH